MIIIYSSRRRPVSRRLQEQLHGRRCGGTAADAVAGGALINQELESGCYPEVSLLFCHLCHILLLVVSEPAKSQFFGPIAIALKARSPESLYYIVLLYYKYSILLHYHYYYYYH